MDYQGPERRQGYVKMDEDINTLKTEIAVLAEKVNQWMDSTTGYRKTLCEKIEKIDNQLSTHVTTTIEKLNVLPCRERQAWYLSLSKQVRWLWALVSGAILLIVGDWVRKR